jgi:transcription initiation factor TFIIH subunit 2
MLDRDMRPTRFDLTLQYAREFIVEWFDQNPLGQIGIVGMRAGIGERVGEMSGSFSAHFANTRRPSVSQGILRMS